MADNKLSKSELKDLVNSLTSNCCQVLEKSLWKLNEHFRLPEHFRFSQNHQLWYYFWEDFKVKEFYKIDGLTNILQLLLKPDAKWVQKAIDILTICCSVKEYREMISNTETISSITTLFKSYDKNEIIQVSLCKTISCLSLQEEACTIFHKLDINSSIVDLLIYCQLSDSENMAISTLKSLNEFLPSREQTIQVILTKVIPTDNDLMIKLVRALAALKFGLQSCTEISAKQILTTIGIANLVTYAQSRDKNLQRASVTILTQISDKSDEIRRQIGEAGMVPIYINLVQEFLYDDEMSPLYGLSQLLQHVDNRGRIFYIFNGFETLISLLRRWDEFGRCDYFDSEIQEWIMDAIQEFFFDYNESYVLKFLNLDLVSILVNILGNFVTTTKIRHELNEGTKSGPFTELFPNIRHISQIVHILTVVASKRKFRFRFLNSVILDVLLRAWLFGSYDRDLRGIKDILMTLICSNVCLEGLILLQFPQIVQKKIDYSALPHSVHFCKMSILNAFERKVHSEYGLEKINRLLTTGSESVKRTVALMLPYILTTEVERYSQASGVYYLALESFLKNLADPSNDNFQVSLNIFFEICEKAQSSDIGSFSHETHKRDYCVINGKEFDKDVHFILDDGERVSANRSLLIQSSDMFAAMLNGHFMEANQSEIRFKCASTEIFKFILHFLHGCTDSGETSCLVLRNAHYKFLFEASDMADRMVLMNLKDFILGIIPKKLTRCSALSACRYAQQNNYTTFLSLLVDHLVKLSVRRNYKTDLFTQILSSDLNEHLIDEIKLKIESFLNFYTKERKQSFVDLID